MDDAPENEPGKPDTPLRLLTFFRQDIDYVRTFQDRDIAKG